MKKKILFLVIAIVLVVLSVSAQNDDRLVVNAGNAGHIRIESNMNVILMPATGDQQSISLNEKASQELGLKLSGNSVTISVVGHSINEKLTVYMYVSNLESITVENNTTVTTVGVLNTPRLDVFVDGGATAHLKTNGEVRAHSLNGGAVKVKDLSKNQIAKF